MRRGGGIRPPPPIREGLIEYLREKGVIEELCFYIYHCKRYIFIIINVSSINQKSILLNIKIQLHKIFSHLKRKIMIKLHVAMCHTLQLQ